ncbi:hypothetical protein [Sphingobium sp. SYK-6]|uniref:hypothetical protein n=1 Tax=Sphingobium sp. (strain NBRC 103272 / SYK-6) TaxID=627192 RepID=UPI0011D2A1AD|nr:hypothetical protein [Sphingobium sp. SYK-6]
MPKPSHCRRGRRRDQGMLSGRLFVRYQDRMVGLKINLSRVTEISKIRDMDVIDVTNAPLADFSKVPQAVSQTIV